MRRRSSKSPLPKEDKLNILFMLSIHGNEKGGREGGVARGVNPPRRLRLSERARYRMSLDNVLFLPRLDAFMPKDHRDVVEHGPLGKLGRYGSQEFNQKPAAAIGTA